MKSAKIKWRDRTPENDIKYSGFLSYRHIRIIAWIFMIIAQIATIMDINMKSDPSSTKYLEVIQNVFSTLGTLPVSLFMLANFSYILQRKNRYRETITLYATLALGMMIFANVIVFYFVFRTMNAFAAGTLSFWDMSMTVGTLLAGMGRAGYVFNVFIDLLLCSLLFFFSDYVPKKHFQGKKIYLFRALVLLPIVYEVSALIVKYYAALGSSFHGFDVPSFVIFLLPSKPPMVFLAFVLIVACLKISKWMHTRRQGNDVETYDIYCTTNAHSLRVSFMISAIFLFCGLLDVIALVIVANFGLGHATAVLGSDSSEINALIALNVIEGTGVGGAIPLIVIIPLVILFSYTKTHKNPKIDTLIPIAGIAGIVLVYILGLFEVAISNIGSLSQRFIEWVKENMPEEEEQKTALINTVLSYVTSIKLI